MATIKKSAGKVPDLQGPWIDKQKTVLSQARTAKCGAKVSKKKLCKGGKVKKGK